mmetsp:Transcript_36245/g.84773  ORF Transcript_36245/g.84773 Transcript_36245/m.84773 type:complete len:259 (+) Transcript_36245:1419-2195(+)
MIRRLVQQQHVVPPQQQTGQRHPPLLSPRQHVRLRIVRRQPQRVRRPLDRPVELPQISRLDDIRQFLQPLHRRVPLRVPQIGIGQVPRQAVEVVQHLPGRGDRRLETLADGFELQLGLLGEVTDGGAGKGTGRALELRVEAGHDAEERALSRTVRSHEADLGAGVETEVDALQDGLALVGQGLLQVQDGVHELSRLGVETGLAHGGLLLGPLASALALSSAPSAAATALVFLFLSVEGGRKGRGRPTFERTNCARRSW